MNEKQQGQQEAAILNAFTVDVEDYYQVSAFADTVRPERWEQFESRVESNTQLLLEMMERCETHGTFFILGWVAQRFPSLVRQIHSAGHELGVHSQWHRLVYDLTPRQFREDAEQSRKTIEDCIGESVGLYRAPSFSITGRSLWALEELVEAGFWLDSSIFPIRHDRYGIPDAHPWPHVYETPAGPIGEFPAAACKVGPTRLPVSGGGYFRILPYQVTRTCLQRINEKWQHAFMFYIHPWEVDPDQPRLKGSLKSRFRHYRNLHTTAAKLERLLQDFSFGTMGAAFAAEMARGQEQGDEGYSNLRRQRIELRQADGGGVPEGAIRITSAERGHRPRVLYLTHRFPYPPNRGDRIRTFHTLRVLSESADVYLGSFNDEPIESSHLDRVRELCREVEVIGHKRNERLWNLARAACLGGTVTEALFQSTQMKSTVLHWASEVAFDAVLTSSSALAQYADIPAFKEIPVVVDLIDVDSQKWREYSLSSQFPLKLVYARESRLLRAVEQRLARQVDRLTVVTEAEAELLRSFAPGAPVSAVQNGVALDYFEPRRGQVAGRCVFVGALDYRPNVEGICSFVRESWPAILAAKPQSTLQIVGREPVAAVRSLGNVSGVEVVGTVPDVRPYLAEAAAVVVPLKIARGVQNKVLEALAMQRPVVASPAAIEGLDVIPGVHLLQADSGREWSDAVCSLIDDPEFGRALGQAGRDQVYRLHNWSSCLRPLLAALELIPSADVVLRDRELQAAP